MSTYFSGQTEQNVNPESEGLAGVKGSLSLNQQKQSGLQRSFGRELSNIDSNTEQVVDTSKANVQNVVNSKENLSTTAKWSSSTEGELEKPVAKPLVPKKDPNSSLEHHTKIEISTGSEHALDDEEAEEDVFDEVDLVDVQNSDNPQYCTNYVREIIDHMRNVEEGFSAKLGYMAAVQNDINEKMRGILIDWLVDVHLKFKLLPETLYLAVNLVDRYLEKVPVTRQKLQLVGVGAMLIASKYEEIYPPEVKEFEYVTDRAYSREEILDIEGKMLNTLVFYLTIPSSLRFLERYTLLARFDEKMLNTAKYILELAMLEYKMLKYTPSMTACAAIYLINKLQKKEGWSNSMARHAKYSELDLRPCAKDLCTLLQNAGKNSLQAVRRKFSSSKYSQAAKIQLEKPTN